MLLKDERGINKRREDRRKTEMRIAFMMKRSVAVF